MTDLNIDRIDPRTAVINPGPEIDIQHAARLRNTLTDLHRDGVTRYVINLADVEFVDSTGLSVLYRAWRRAINDNGALAVVAPRPGVRKALDVARFPAQIHDTIETSLHRTAGIEPGTAKARAKTRRR
jgi:anti-anti-sigma factor